MTAVIPANSPAPMVQDDPASLLALLVRVASDPATDVAKLERMSALVEHQQQRRAEQDFNAAMMAAQAEMPRVQKNSENTHTKSKYANLDAVIKDVTPVYTRHGFSLSFTTAESPKPGLRVMCHVAHVGGYARDYMADMPVDSQGAKNPVQGFGSSMSYARRYLTLMIFNISTTDDDDGNAGGNTSTTLTDTQSHEIDTMLRAQGMEEDKFLAWISGQTRQQIERVADIPADKFQWVVSALKKRAENKAAAK